MRFVKVLAALVLCAAALLSGSAWDMLLWEEMDMEDFAQGLKSLRLKKLDKLPKRYIGDRLIESYDVSQEGRVAVAFTNEQIIAVYDKDFEFQYAISFYLSGAYGVLWCGENVALINCRGDCATVLDENTSPVAMYNIIGCKEEQSIDYWFDIVTVARRNVGEYKYFCYDRLLVDASCENSGTTGGRHVLERTDKNGNVEILYEEEEYWWEPVLSFVVIVAVLSLIIFRVHRTNKMKAQAIIKRHYQEGNGVGYTPPLRKV